MPLLLSMPTIWANRGLSRAEHPLQANLCYDSPGWSTMRLWSAAPPLAGAPGTSRAMGREGTTAHTSGPEGLRRAHIPDPHWGSVREGSHMAENGLILVTGAAGQLGAVGHTVTDLLLERGLPVRAMVRREDDRAAALRAAGAEVVVGDLLEPADVARVVSGCRRVYFGMSVSAAYLEATVLMAAVARDAGVDALVNMSQMTVSQMSLQHTTPSPQQRQHWLSEQALTWAGLPVVTIRPTVFLEGFFLPLTGPSVRDRSRIELPFGRGKTNPVATADVARVIAAVLAAPGPDLRAHRAAVAGHARDRPGVRGRAQPGDHVHGHPSRGVGTGAAQGGVAGAPDPSSGDDGRVEPGRAV